MSERIVTEEIPAALAGERLDRIVALIGEVSRADAAAVIEAGGVEVDRVRAASGKVRLAAGQVVAIRLDLLPQPALPEPDGSIPLDIVHVDDDVVVVNKSPGLVVHPAAGHTGGTLVNALIARFPEIASVGDPQRPGIVHRLDIGTSGLLVAARSARAYDALVGALSRREVYRDYVALVWGRVEAPNGTIDAPIGRDPRDPMRMTVVESGKPARTHYEVRRSFDAPEVTLLDCHLETGRTHQIRVHLAAIGHPVVADATYGGRRPGVVLDRPFLHAGRLSFSHPVSGTRLEFSAPLPTDLQVVLDRCH